MVTADNPFFTAQRIFYYSTHIVFVLTFMAITVFRHFTTSCFNATAVAEKNTTCELWDMFIDQETKITESTLETYMRSQTRFFTLF